MKKTILFCANTSWYLYNFRLSTIEAMIAIGCEVVCVSGDQEYARDLERIGCQSYTVALSSTSKNPLFELYTIFSLLRVMLIYRTVMFTFTPKLNIYCSILGKLLNLPVVVNISGMGSGISSGKVLKFCMAKLYQICGKSASYVFVQNISDYKRFSEEYSIDRAKLELLPGSGVDLERFQNTAKLIRDESPFVFGFFSRLLVSKGVMDAVEAFSILPKHKNIKLLIAGQFYYDRNDAVTEDDLRKAIHGKQIEYLGHLRDIENHMSKCHCIVLPSRYPEGTPKVLIEALAMGKILITTDTPGCNETVMEGLNGFLVPPGDVISLASALEHASNLTCEQYMRMSGESRKIAERKYDERFVISSYIKILKNFQRELRDSA